MNSPENVVHFEYNGVQYNMTEDEVEAAYRYQLRRYRLQDAQRQLDVLVYGSDGDIDTEDTESEQARACFAEQYGIGYEKASTDDMLEEYLRRFENRFDCNYDENSQWEAAIIAVLEDCK